MAAVVFAGALGGCAELVGDDDSPMSVLKACGDAPYVAVATGRTSENNENSGYGVDVYGIDHEGSIKRLTEDARTRGVTIKDDASEVYASKIPTLDEAGAEAKSSDSMALAVAIHNLSAVFTIDPGTGDEKRLTTAPGVTSLDISPDAATLAVAADTGPVTAMTDPTGNISYSATTLQFTIPVASPEERTPLIAPPQPREAWVSRLQWTPDGHNLSYLSQSGTAPYELHVYDVSTGKDRTLAIGDPNGYLAGYSWSPDGSTILLTQYLGDVPGFASEIDVATGTVTDLGELGSLQVAYADKAGDTIIGFISESADDGDILRRWIRDEETGKFVADSSTETEVKHANDFHIAACAL